MSTTDPDFTLPMTISSARNNLCVGICTAKPGASDASDTQTGESDQANLRQHSAVHSAMGVRWPNRVVSRNKPVLLDMDVAAPERPWVRCSWEGRLIFEVRAWQRQSRARKCLFLTIR